MTGCRVVRGRHRCAEADLVVVRDLSILHDVGALAADEDIAVSFLYVVALGLDVVTATQLPAASRKKAAFRVGERLNVECTAVACLAASPCSPFKTRYTGRRLHG